MKIGQDLDDHYERHPNWDTNDKEVKLINASMYDRHETWYWVLKHLILPILGFLIILFVFILPYFVTIEYVIISSIVAFVFSIFVSTFFRELIRYFYYRIKVGVKIREDGEIDDDNNLSDEEKEKENILNSIKTDESFKIGFVGDIMRMKKYRLTFHDKVKEFFKDTDIIVGNLEGILTGQPGPISKQSHQDNILCYLNKLLNPVKATQWLLCVSNNHSADFGFSNFNNTLYKIQNTDNFNAFGRNDTTNVFLHNEKINITPASAWSNQKNWDYISKYDDGNLTRFHKPEKFNILYPHWGYENEKYVRKNIQEAAETHLKDKKWDLIFGQHPHVRQPVVKIKDNDIWKLVAFSGGNFTSGVKIIRRKKHIYGIIMRCEIGPLVVDPNKLGIGKVNWRYTKNEIVEDPTIDDCVSPPVSNGPTKQLCIDKKRCPISWVSLIFAILTLGLMYLLRLIEAGVF